jgi:hypothetical protein
MRRDRFHWIILQCVHANNNAGALPRGNLNHDPAHKVRRIFDLINKVFKEKYAAARDLTVDESMVGHKGRDYTVQYMPAKKAHRWQDHDLDFPLVKHLHYCLHVHTAKLSGTGHGALSW